MNMGLDVANAKNISTLKNLFHKHKIIFLNILNAHNKSYYYIKKIIINHFFKFIKCVFN